MCRFILLDKWFSSSNTNKCKENQLNSCYRLWWCWSIIFSIMKHASRICFAWGRRKLKKLYTTLNVYYYFCTNTMFYKFWMGHWVFLFFIYDQHVLLFWMLSNSLKRNSAQYTIENICWLLLLWFCEHRMAWRKRRQKNAKKRIMQDDVWGLTISHRQIHVCCC